jgi:drug/metabolite transporter (DMT)-like permease
VRGRTLIYVEVLFAVVAWGASFVATKVALRDVQPFTVVWLRFAMGVLILALVVIRRGQWAVPKRRELFAFAGIGFLGITFHQWLQSTALVYTQATTTAWIVTTSPVFIAILGAVALRERLKPPQVAGIVLASAGVLLLVSRGNIGALFSGAGWSLGDILVLISAVNWAVFSVLSRGLMRTHPAARALLYVMGSGWLFTSMLFLPGPGLADIANLTRPGWLGVLFLGIGCSGLAYIAWYDALLVLPVSQAGVFLYLEPLVTLVVAWWVLREPVSWVSLLGGGVILLGVWLVNRKAR